jgi:hypothetical protein
MPKNVIVRSDRAGCFHGELTEYDKVNGVITLKNARRLWYWDGASSLSELATLGTSKPENCKFPVPVEVQTVHGVLEVIWTTEQADKSISEVKAWTQH